MCGIAGFFDRRNSAEVAERDVILGKQIETLAHRGPDGHDVWNGPGVGLAHARLAVVDLSPAGAQPMWDTERRLCVVFNGEIYNFQALRAELQATGHHFRSRTDTEVLLAGYRAWGDRLASRLRGMFAIALYDSERQSLTLLRDRIGKKPLYYTLAGGVLVFASEIKAILTWPGISRQPDWAAIHDYLTYQYVPAPHTAFHGIQKLPAAHKLVVSRGSSVRIERYDRLPEPRAAAASKASPAELADELVERLRQATRLRLIADVPLGAFLSGGVDSSAVVAMMALESASPVRTFTIGFDEDAYDERPFARTVARFYGTDHSEIIVRPDAMAVLPSLVWHYGEPFADSSAIATYYVSQVARQSVTVALNGDGGDESFLGYPRYAHLAQAETIRSRMPRPLCRALARVLASVGEPARGLLMRRVLSRAAAVLDAQPSRRYEPSIAYFSDAAKHELYGAGMRGHLARSSLDILDPYFDAADTLAAGAAWADLHTYLPDDLLVKVDVASMAHGLECRSPLLDQELMRWAAQLPSCVKMANGEPKSLLKLAMEPYLPRDLLYRPKMGFGVPIDHWLRNEMYGFAHHTLLEGPAARRGLFNLAAVRGMLERHRAGEAFAPRIWALLMLELWLQMWIDGPLPARPAAHPARALAC